MKNSQKPPKITIIGIITAMEWDENDNVITVKISAPDEEEYVIEDNSLADELLELLYEAVKVTGYVSESEFGYKTLLVEDYELLDDDEFSYKVNDGF